MTHPLVELLHAIGRDDDEIVGIPTGIPTPDDRLGEVVTYWPTVAGAGGVADRWAGQRHVWFNVQPMTRPERGRGTQHDVIEVRCLYADLDFEVPGKEAGLAPEQAVAIISDLAGVLGAGPNAVVRSGYGLQPFWAIEPVDVVEGALLLARWRQTVISVAAARGVVVDTGVYDLPRMLRAPGPPNLKRGTSAETGLQVRDADRRLRLASINAALDSYAPITDSLRRAHSENVSRRTGEIPQVHVGDRVFTDSEAMEFIEEFALSRVRSTPWGGGADYWKVIWEAAMTCSNFSEMFLADDLRDMIRRAVADGHEGVGTDAADEYQIAMGFMKGREWLARRPTANEEADPFSSHCTLPGRLAEEHAGATDYDVVDASGVVLVSSDELSTDDVAAGVGGRRLKVLRASEIEMESCDWLWEHEGECWIPLGGLVLLGGREGVGKSTWTARLVAQLTTGRMEGEFLNKPRSVIVSATEDAWPQTIIPRLVAAGADLRRVLRVDAVLDDTTVGLSLPHDVPALRKLMADEDVVMVVLDPLLSTIGGGEQRLDTHKDSDVRKALEPITLLAAESRATFLGLIHQNKSQSGDLLTKLMGSRAFSAVARAVLVCAEAEAPESGEMDPFAPGTRPARSFLFGQLKNNLGARVESSVRYELTSAIAGHDGRTGKPVRTSKVSVTDYAHAEGVEEAVTALEAKKIAAKRKGQDKDGGDPDEAPDMSKVDQAMEFIGDFMSNKPEGVTANSAIKGLEELGFGRQTYTRARSKLGICAQQVPGHGWMWRYTQ